MMRRVNVRHLHGHRPHGGHHITGHGHGHHPEPAPGRVGWGRHHPRPHHGPSADKVYQDSLKGYEEKLRRIYGGGGGHGPHVGPDAGYEAALKGYKARLDRIYGGGFTGGTRSYEHLLDRYYGRDYATSLRRLHSGHRRSPHQPPADHQPIPHRKPWWAFL